MTATAYNLQGINKMQNKQSSQNKISSQKIHVDLFIKFHNYSL